MNIAAQGEAPGEAVVADYLANRLSDAEAQAFEVYCLEHPDFAREVERELALKTGLREAHKLVAAVGPSTPKRRFGRWPLAFAASVAVLATVGLVIQYSIQRQTPLVAFASLANLPDSLRHSAISRVSLLRVRGNDAAMQVSAAPDSVVEIRLLPDSESKSGDYAIQISAESLSIARSLIMRRLRPAADGFLELYMPANQMVGRTWVISVADDSDRKSQSRKVFRVQFVNPSDSGK